MEKSQHAYVSLVMTFIIIPLSGFATDMYIPSLPNMASSLHVSALQAQIILSLFLVSYGISQLVVGSLLDAFGRHNLSIGAMFIFALTCLIIAKTNNIYLIYAMRIIHGVCIAIIIVAKRAFFVDVYTGDKLKSYLSAFTIIWSTGPIIAPFIGGYLQDAYGWQSNFYFLAVYSFSMGILEIIFSVETLKTTTEFSLKRVVRIYEKMIRTISFTRGLMMLGLAGSMLMVYNLTGVFILEHKMGLTPVMAGYGSLLSGIAWMTGGIIGKTTIKRPLYKKLFINNGLQVLFVLIMLGSYSLLNSWYFFIVFVFIIHTTAGYTYNNYFTFSMSKFPEYAGIAGGLSGGVSYILMSLLSYSIIYFIPARDPLNLSFSYMILILLSTIVLMTTINISDNRVKTLIEKAN
jgi:MFS family permease